MRRPADDRRRRGRFPDADSLGRRRRRPDRDRRVGDGRPGVLDRGPPEVAITIENVWTRTREFHFEYTAPFTPLAGRDPDGVERLHLAPLGGQAPDGDGGWTGESVWSHLVPEAPENACWRITNTYSRNRREGGTVWSATPGESVTREYVVLDARDASECFPSGTYRFDGGWSEETPEGDLPERSAEFVVDVAR